MTILFLKMSIISRFTLILLGLIEIYQADKLSITNLDCDVYQQPSTKSQPFCEWLSTTPDKWQFLYYNASKGRPIQWDGAEYGPTIYVNAIQLYRPDSAWSSNDDEILSPEIDASSLDVPWCFHLQYYIHGQGVGNLSVKFQHGSDEKVMWNHIGQGGDMWHNQRVLIKPPSTDFKLKIEATPLSGAIALASSKVYSYQCFTPGTFQCSFESNDCEDIWFNSLNNSKYNWEVVQGDHNDHYLEAKSGNSGDQADLVSESIEPLNLATFPDDHCLKFWYRLSDSKKDNLSVLVGNTNDLDNSKILWSSTNYLPSHLPSHMWHHAKVFFAIDKNDKISKQIMIRAINIAKDSPSSIQIDDIQLNRDNSADCLSPIQCNFDDDMCSWTHDLGQQFRWEHGIGRVTNSRVLPSDITNAPYDVTEGEGSSSIHYRGMYMFTDFTTKMDKEKSVVIMNSEFVTEPLPRTHLYFKYIPLVFSDPGNKFSVKLLDPQGTLISTVFTMGVTNTTTKWTQAKIEIPSAKIFSISFEVETYNPQTYLAIDDIHYI